MTSSRSEDRHLDSSYTEKEGTLEGISPRLPGTRTGVLSFPVWRADLTSFMDPNLGMLQHIPSPTYKHAQAQTSQKHFKLILLVVVCFSFQDFLFECWYPNCCALLADPEVVMREGLPDDSADCRLLAPQPHWLLLALLVLLHFLKRQK